MILLMNKGVNSSVSTLETYLFFPSRMLTFWNLMGLNKIFFYLHRSKHVIIEQQQLSAMEKFLLFFFFLNFLISSSSLPADHELKAPICSPLFLKHLFSLCYFQAKSRNLCCFFKMQILQSDSSSKCASKLGVKKLAQTNPAPLPLPCAESWSKELVGDSAYFLHHKHYLFQTFFFVYYCFIIILIGKQ